MCVQFEDVNLFCIHVHMYVPYAPSCVCMCVQFSIQTFKYICFICTPLNLCLAVFNCVLMWLPMGIYGISNMSTFTTNPSHISNTQL